MWRLWQLMFSDMNFMTSSCLRFLKLWKSHFCLLVALADILFMLHVKMKTLLFKWIIIWLLSSWDPANMSSCAGLISFTLHKMYGCGVYLSYPETNAPLQQMEQAQVGAQAELKSEIVSAAMPLLIPARLWTVWLEITSQRGRGCYAHQMCRKIWDNLYGVLKTYGLTVFAPLRSKIT